MCDPIGQTDIDSSNINHVLDDVPRETMGYHGFPFIYVNVYPRVRLPPVTCSLVTGPSPRPRGQLAARPCDVGRRRRSLRDLAERLGEWVRTISG